MRLTRLTVIVCAIAALGLAGCSKPQANNPVPATASSSGATTSSSVSLTTNPLDVSKIQNDPCSAFTAAQLAPVMGDIRKSQKSNDKDGSTCTWYPADGHRAAISLNVYPNLGGLAGLDGQREFYSFFQKINPVSGYPAAHASTLGTVEGACQTIVAVSDKAGFGVFSQNSSSTAPDFANQCVGPDQLAPQVIAALK